ncbi:hypothetical protein P153DRAFT_284030 [Dothidotthia symphoricarpi CBS 119687]|uniref:Altered inheritance of mitochondria protein 9, mitochondrial n=1 Tax=Dothidotthia symphoricarpi CBS 119687 TaxID=1392245 RepID=A0A6A6AMM9_9PLEO|nr:uncharacterized protein P153DRAFT_284030 [Dothidotthia symphoricarpi CBS 119687]KAF2132816.1 hypothetical protein P153DRAFT_284030 [Dothidotthia symphoricarpi CBS 119687]
MFTAANPYLYTTGRWLNHDKLHREARHVEFDFAALCAKAVNVCTGATNVVRYEKKEGGFNRAFLLCLDNGARVVARVPYHIAGPRRLTTNSEVATMAYVRSFTNIPIPKVLDWNDDATSIGTEYIIMEHALGVQLHDKWSSMSPHQHMLCVKNIAFVMTEMAKLSFPVYGSLYFADAPIDPKLKSDFVEGFCIGPHCGTQYWNCNAGEARFYEERSPNRGPWSDLQSYCSGLIDAGFSRIPKVDPQARLSYHGSVKEHLRLLDVTNRVIQELTRSSIIEKVADPTLLHPDIHKRNIYVSEEDPSCITAIIDWQSTSIEPAFVYANDTPDLVEDPTADIPILGNLMSLEGGPSDAEPSKASKATTAETPEEEAARKRHEKDVLTCRKTFEVVLLGYMRKLHDARAMDPTLLRSIRYCDVSWRISATALRQELIDLSQHWTALGLPGLCPYQPTSEELAEHAKQYEDFETVQQLKLFLKRALDVESDGWVPANKWVATKVENTKLFGQWVESIKESGGSEDRARALWPFGEGCTLQTGITENT